MSFASVAAPLLAGFSLAAIVDLTGRSDGGTRGEAAIVAFALAAGLLIYAIQAGLAAGQLAVSPDQRAAQVPEARGYAEWMQRLRQDQWRDAALAERLFVRTRLAYNLGILAFLGGLVGVLLPGPGEWNALRIAAVTIAAAAGAVELVLVSGRLRRVSHWLLPMFHNAPQGETELSHREPDEMDDTTAQWLIYGDRNDTTSQGLAYADDRDVTAALTTLTAQLASLTGQLARLQVAIGDAASQLAGDLDDAPEQST